MPNLARFRINQSTTGTFGYARRDILPTSEAVELQFEAENAGLVYLWDVIQPPGSNVTPGSTTSQTATFAAELDGGYIAKLTVNPGSADEDVDSLYFGIGTDIDGNRYCLPALNETIQDNSLGHPEWGWWEKLYTFLRALASYAGTGGGDTFFEVGDGTESLQRKDFGDAQGDYSWALGIDSTSLGTNSWAFGSDSIATGASSIAFGAFSFAEGDNSFVFGSNVRSLAGSTCFGEGYQNVFPKSVVLGYSNSPSDQVSNPQTTRVPVNGVTTSSGTVSQLTVDPVGYFSLGPIPAYSFLNIQVHVVAKSDGLDGSVPALVTFDGEIQALSGATTITYQDWTITKNILTGTPVYSEDVWDLYVPATSPDLNSLDIHIVQDSTNSTPDVVWSGYLDIAIVSTIPSMLS
jgi:hypothetical protein